MEISTPEAALSLMSSLIPLLSRPPFSKSSLDKVPSSISTVIQYVSVLECVWGLCSSAPLKSYVSILDQLGFLCKGLVRVGGQLERDNPYALHRLQVRCYSHHQIFIVTDSQIMNGLLVSDSVQGLLTNLCQDSSLDIVLRLQILEVGFYFESDAQFLACRVSR